MSARSSLQGVELARELREVVVELGQLLDLDGLHGDRDVGLLALGLAAGQLALERRRIARGQAGERLVQAVEHRPAADLVRLAGRLRVLDRARRPRSRTGRWSCSRRPPPGRCAVLRLAKRSRRLSRYSSTSSSVTSALSTVTTERGEVGELELGPDLDLGRERELLAVVELGDLHVRLAEDEHLGLLHRLAVELGQRVVHRLAQHRATADPHVDDARRNLARPEPGDARLLRHLFVSLVEARLELLEGNLDAQPDTGRAQLFDIGLHGGVTPETWMD